MDRQAWVKLIDGAIAWHPTGFEMHLGSAADNRGSGTPPASRRWCGAVFKSSPAHDAEIDDGDAAIGQHEHVAGVRVGVEKAVAKHLAKRGGGGTWRSMS